MRTHGGIAGADEPMVAPAFQSQCRRTALDDCAVLTGATSEAPEQFHDVDVEAPRLEGSAADRLGSERRTSSERLLDADRAGSGKITCRTAWFARVDPQQRPRREQRMAGEPACIRDQERKAGLGQFVA